MKCHICGKSISEEDLEVSECVTCGELTCEDCCVSFTQFNQCTETLCVDCGEYSNEMRGQEQDRIDKENEKKEKIRLERNRKARIRYHSPEQREKRRIKKEQLRLERIKLEMERAKKLAKIMQNIFGGM